MSDALSGLLVVDLGRIVAAPMCSMLLGDLGARVVKVEPAPDGDFLRSSQPEYAEGIGSYFATVNRNKESIALDLRSAGGRKVLDALLDRADVLVENFRPGVLEAIGLGDEALTARYPRLIAVRLSAYGHEGPMAGDPGVDQMVQGLSGLMAVTGTPESGPIRCGIAISDILCALTGTIGALAALQERTKSGRGQIVRGSLLQAMMSMMSVQAGKYLASGEVPVPEGNHHPAMAPYGLFPTADGAIQFQIMTDEDFKFFAELCGEPGWADDPLFATAQSRSANRVAVRDAVAQATPRRTTADWLACLKELNVPCGPVLDIGEAFESAQAKAMGLVQRLTLSNGDEIALPGFPLSFTRSPMRLRQPPPFVGEHTEALLTELGLAGDTQAIAAIVRKHQP